MVEQLYNFIIDKFDVIDFGYFGLSFGYVFSYLFSLIAGFIILFIPFAFVIHIIRRVTK